MDLGLTRSQRVRRFLVMPSIVAAGLSVPSFIEWGEQSLLRSSGLLAIPALVLLLGLYIFRRTGPHWLRVEADGIYFGRYGAVVPWSDIAASTDWLVYGPSVIALNLRIHRGRQRWLARQRGFLGRWRATFNPEKDDVLTLVPGIHFDGIANTLADAINEKRP